MIKALKGMKDLFEPENKRYEFVIQTSTNIAKKYGFELVQTPILEESSLFLRSVGESSDIVGKEMYRFVDKGGNDVCLRPEGTAGVVRAFIEHKMDRAGVKKRYFYHGPMYRYERPQKGRFRQFHQFGVESFGIDDPKEDAFIIAMLKEILDNLGVKATLKLNSLGCPECMPKYREKLIEFLNKTPNLCEDCLRRKELNPIRVLDCKNSNCQMQLKDAPLMSDHLCSSCSEDFKNLQEFLTILKIDFSLDPWLVRGLDYYTKSAFEFISDEIGAQSAVAGGGRYDRLVEFLGGKPTKGIGFAMGIERLLELAKPPLEPRSGVYLGVLSESATKKALKATYELRKKIKTVYEYELKSLKSHLKQADKSEFLWCACIGENELIDDTVWVKNLENKEERTVPYSTFKDGSWLTMD